MYKVIAFGGVNFIHIIYCYFYESFRYGNILVNSSTLANKSNNWDEPEQAPL